MTAVLRYIWVPLACASLAACQSAPPRRSATGDNAPDQLIPPVDPGVDAFGLRLPPGLKLVERGPDFVVAQGKKPRSEVLEAVRSQVEGGTTEEGPTMTALQRVTVVTPDGDPHLVLRVQVASVSDDITRVTVIPNP